MPLPYLMHAQPFDSLSTVTLAPLASVPTLLAPVEGALRTFSSPLLVTRAVRSPAVGAAVGSTVGAEVGATVGEGAAVCVTTAVSRPDDM